MSIPILERLTQKAQKSGIAISNNSIGDHWVCAGRQSLRDFSRLLQPPGDVSWVDGLFNGVLVQQESEPITYCPDGFCLSDDSIFNDLSCAENGQILSEYLFPFIHSFSFLFLSFDCSALKTGMLRQQAAQPGIYFVFQRMTNKNQPAGNESVRGYYDKISFTRCN
ncbi:hypothetical protein [Necropsobacter massiliensis]|uniref:hypothetical protein n=1 Tax=Necropsobacter massiliensis TaxID=1400001 RepID=UPI00059601E0|nr:hypothetical protein [Necropsobacter massiliensis]